MVRKNPFVYLCDINLFFPFAVNVFIHQSIPSMGVIFHDIPIIHLRVICCTQIHISFSPSSNQYLCFLLPHCIWRHEMQYAKNIFVNNIRIVLNTNVGRAMVNTESNNIWEYYLFHNNSHLVANLLSRLNLNLLGQENSHPVIPIHSWCLTVTASDH